MMQWLLAGAFTLGAACSAASAAVYHPSFDGPDLDPSLTFTADPGISYTNSFNTLGIYKAGGVTKASSIFVSDFVVTGDFDATITLRNAAYLGSSRFFFAADAQANSAQALGFVSRDSDLFATADGPRYSVKAAQLLGSSKSVHLADNEVVFELRRGGGYSDVLINGSLVDHVFVGAAALPPLSFNFGLINSGFASDLDPLYRAAFVADFTVTTPGVPEPASWALLVAGFALAGSAQRRRREMA